MKRLLAVALCWLCSFGVGFSQGAPVWESRYLRAQSADQLNVCIAEVQYSNAWFTARLYGEEFNFLYSRDDFTLPYGAVLGTVVFSVDGQVFEVIASTFDRRPSDSLSTAQMMQLSPRKADHGALFNTLKFGSRFSIVFPNGDSYPISLRGSDRALSGASNCWARNPTGVHSNNPFEAPESGNNPFGGDVELPASDSEL